MIIQPSVLILVELFQSLFWFISAADDHQSNCQLEEIWFHMFPI